MVGLVDGFGVVVVGFSGVGLEASAVELAGGVAGAAAGETAGELAGPLATAVNVKLFEINVSPLLNPSKLSKSTII